MRKVVMSPTIAFIVLRIGRNMTLTTTILLIM